MTHDTCFKFLCPTWTWVMIGGEVWRIPSTLWRRRSEGPGHRRSRSPQHNRRLQLRVERGVSGHCVHYFYLAFSHNSKTSVVFRRFFGNYMQANISCRNSELEEHFGWAQSPNGIRVGHMDNTLFVYTDFVPWSRWKCLEVCGVVPNCTGPIC